MPTELELAITDEVEKFEAAAAARRARIAAVNAAITGYRDVTGRIPAAASNASLDEGVRHLLASEGCVGLLMPGAPKGFIDETQRPGSPVTHGQPTTAAELTGHATRVAAALVSPEAQP